MHMFGIDISYWMYLVEGKQVVFYEYESVLIIRMRGYV